MVVIKWANRGTRTQTIRLINVLLCANTISIFDYYQKYEIYITCSTLKGWCNVLNIKQYYT